MGWSRVEDLTGREFGRLKVIARAGVQGVKKRPVWECECACGRRVKVESRSLKQFRVSCGACRARGKPDGPRGLNCARLSPRLDGNGTEICRRCDVNPSIPNRGRTSAFCRRCLQARHVWRRLCSRYRLSDAEVDALFREAEGRCGACGVAPASGDQLCVEHCHKTGRVRGLVCHPCNLAIAAVESGHLNAAIGFLASDGARQNGVT